MKSSSRVLFAIFLLTLPVDLLAQEEPYPFWNDIRQFKMSDSLRPPPKNAILFVGSSSFTNWKDVQDYFPGYVIINRGFGGSSLTDVIRYADEIIYPYKPKQVVIYCGENDLAANDSVTASMVFARFLKLFTMIRRKLRGVPVVYVSMKPSPSRLRLIPAMETANEQIKTYLKTKKRTAFVDVYHKMLTRDGQPIDSIFNSDKLHMNKYGYTIWKKEITPILMK